MKTALLLVLCVAASAVVRGETLKATITEQTKMELTRGKGTIVLKAGTKVDVVSQDGDMLGVVYRSITGLVPAAKTDFKGEVPKASAMSSKEEPAAAPKPVEPPKAAQTDKTAEPKPAPEKTASTSDAPTTNYGKMVKKARDNEASHKENMVDPTNENVGAPKKD